MKKLKELKFSGIGKWPKRILYILIGFLILRGCSTGCDKIFTTEESTTVTEVDTTDKLKEYPLGRYNGQYKSIVEVGLEEVDKYTKYDARVAPIYGALIWYTEGEILDMYRNIAINDEVVDTLNWEKFKEDSIYKIKIMEQIIVE